MSRATLRRSRSSWAMPALTFFLALNLGFLIGRSPLILPFVAPLKRTRPVVTRHALSGMAKLKAAGRTSQAATAKSLEVSASQGCVLMLDNRLKTVLQQQRAEAHEATQSSEHITLETLLNQAEEAMGRQDGWKERQDSASWRGRRVEAEKKQETAAARDEVLDGGGEWEIKWTGDGARGWEEGSIEDQGSKLPYYLAAVAINRAYADKHGYRFILSNGSAYVQQGEEDVHTSWLKVAMLRHQLHCCCNWAFFIDSDAYFRMESHTLSIAQWLQTLWESVNSNASELAQSQIISGRSQLYLPDDPRLLLRGAAAGTGGLAALFPRNYEDPKIKWSPDKEQFINAGVSLWSNSSLSLKILDDWYEGRKDPAARNTHPFEQRKLNLVIMHRYVRHIGIVPYAEMTGPRGRLVRHIWHPEGEDARRTTLQAALLGTLLLHRELKLPQQ